MSPECINVETKSFTVLHPGQGHIFTTYNNINVLRYIYIYIYNLIFKVPYFLLHVNLYHLICFLTARFFPHRIHPHRTLLDVKSLIAQGDI